MNPAPSEIQRLKIWLDLFREWKGLDKAQGLAVAEYFDRGCIRGFTTALAVLGIRLDNTPTEGDES